MTGTHDIAGLTKGAKEFVEELDEITSARYVCCFFTGERLYNLGTWITQEGEIIREIPQEERHHNEVVTFTCLKDNHGNRFYLWPYEMIEEQMDSY